MFNSKKSALLQAHKLKGEKLKLREVVTVDIANDSVKPSDYKEDEDPTKFKSEKTGRGPLTGPQWWKKVGSCTVFLHCFNDVKEGHTCIQNYTRQSWILNIPF